MSTLLSDMYEAGKRSIVRRVFYSFHYDADNWRAAKVRQIGFVVGDRAATDNEWESVRRGDDTAIERWIAGQLEGRTCTIVLIGTNTAGREWIDYEIKKSWNDGKGLLGIYIHNLKDRDERQAAMGSNVFENFTINSGQTSLASVVKAYNPPYSDSKLVYAYISQNLSNWVHEAIRIRKEH